MRKLGLILLLMSPLGCSPADSPDKPSTTPTDSNATSAAVRSLDDTETVQVAIAVPAMK